MGGGLADTTRLRATTAALPLIRPFGAPSPSGEGFIIIIPQSGK